MRKSTYLSLLPGLRLFLDTFPPPNLETTGTLGPSLSRADCLRDEDEDLLLEDECLLSAEWRRSADLAVLEWLGLFGDLWLWLWYTRGLGDSRLRGCLCSSRRRLSRSSSFLLSSLLRSSSRRRNSSRLLSSSIRLNFSSSRLISSSRLLISCSRFSSMWRRSSSFLASSRLFLSSFLLSSSIFSFLSLSRSLSLSGLSLSLACPCPLGGSGLLSLSPCLWRWSPLSLAGSLASLSLLGPGPGSRLSRLLGGSLLLLRCQLLQGSAPPALLSRSPPPPPPLSSFLSLSDLLLVLAPCPPAGPLLL